MEDYVGLEVQVKQMPIMGNLSNDEKSTAYLLAVKLREMARRDKSERGMPFMIRLDKTLELISDFYEVDTSRLIK